ncbi:hypothetical protein [Stappia sp.]|uniref:hypothetical protein n=1 Tax=Stappia sp. TaxID=1870903 RepID=UPI003A9A1F0D
MAESLHPLAPHHIPFFLPDADGGDRLMTTMFVGLVVAVVVLGSLYMRLHSLPERIAHGNDRMQFEIVAILALLALFTHNNLFWVAALLLAFIRLPDFVTPLGSIADSLGTLARRERVARTVAGTVPDDPPDALRSDVPPPDAPVSDIPVSDAPPATAAPAKTAVEDQASVTDAGGAEPARPDAQSPGRP